LSTEGSGDAADWRPPPCVIYKQLAKKRNRRNNPFCVI
jgi:hypothetical protein